MESDATQSDFILRLWAWADANKKGLLWGVVALVVVGSATGIYFWHQNEQQSAANNMLSSILSRSQSNERVDSTSAFLRVADDYPGTDAGARAILLAGGSLFTEGKYPQAKGQFEKYLSQFPDGTFVGQALLGVAACFDAQGNTPEAIAAYKDIAEHRSGDIASLQAKLQLGRLSELQGNVGQASDFYEQIARPEYGPIGQEAYSLLMDLRNRHPELILYQALSTNAPAATPAPKH